MYARFSLRERQIIFDQRQNWWKTEKFIRKRQKINKNLHMRHDPELAWFIPPIHRREPSRRDFPWSCEEESLVFPSAVVSFLLKVPERWNLWTSSWPLLSVLESEKENKLCRLKFWVWESFSLKTNESKSSASSCQIFNSSKKASFGRALANFTKLTDYFVVVFILYSHFDILYAEIHFDVLNTKESSVVIFFLVWNAFEVNFAFNSIVFTPIFPRTRSFDQQPEMFDVEVGKLLMSKVKTHKTPVDLKLDLTLILGISYVSWNW